MDISEIEELVGILRKARISELTVASGGVQVRLRKRLGDEPFPLVQTQMSKEAEPAPATVEPETDPSPAPVYITSSMVGIFHSIDSVSTVGTVVKAGQVVGAIESMKLMNDVTSEYDGVIAEVLVEDGMPVEYGQQLFRLDPLQGS